MCDRKGASDQSVHTTKSIYDPTSPTYHPRAMTRSLYPPKIPYSPTEWHDWCQDEDRKIMEEIRCAKEVQCTEKLTGAAEVRCANQGTSLTTD